MYIVCSLVVYVYISVAINVNMLLINYSEWGRGTNEGGVKELWHWMPFLMQSLNYEHK